MQVDFFGNTVRCETDGRFVSLTDLARAGNKWRAEKGKAPRPLAQVLDSQGFKEFLSVAQADAGGAALIKAEGRGNTKRTMATAVIAVYVAEQYSTEFHYKVIKTFLEGKLLEFREYGGTEFKAVNAAIDLYLPGRDGKSNTGCYIQAAKALRAKILGADAEAGDWDKASVAQIHARYEAEKKLSGFLEAGLVRDWDHLKELIDKL